MRRALRRDAICSSARSPARVCLRWVAILALGAACEPPRRARLDLPEANTLLVLDQREGTVVGRVFSMERPTHLVVSPESSRVAALFYDESPREFGLTVGELTLVSEGARLPTPDRVFVFDPESDESGFIEGPIPAAFSDLRIPQESRCASFAVDSVQLGGAPIGVVKDGESALVVTSTGFFRVGRDLKPSRIEAAWPRGLIAEQPSAGVIWLMGGDGRVVVGSSLDGFAEAPALPVPGPKMLAAGPGGTRELWVATSSAAVFELFEGAWHPRAPETPRHIRLASMVAVAPRRVWMTGTDTFDLRQVDATGASMVPFVGVVSNPAEGEPILLGMKPASGICVGTSEHYVYVHGPGDWIGIDTQLGDLTSFFELGGRLLGTGDQGDVQGVAELWPDCAPQLLLLQRVVSTAVVGQTAFVLGDFLRESVLLTVELE